MKRIDLEPKDYRAAPIKGEKAFTPDGVIRLVAIAAMVIAVLLLNRYAYPHFKAGMDWFWSLFG